MQETKKDSDLEPLTNSGYNVNNTKGQNTTELDNEIQARKKKKIKYGLIGGVALIALVLIIVLPIVLVKKKDDHHDDDHHDDHPPLETNPYSVDKSSIVDNESSLTGILYLNT